MMLGAQQRVLVGRPRAARSGPLGPSALGAAKRGRYAALIEMEIENEQTN